LGNVAIVGKNIEFLERGFNFLKMLQLSENNCYCWKQDGIVGKSWELLEYMWTSWKIVGKKFGKANCWGWMLL